MDERIGKSRNQPAVEPTRAASGRDAAEAVVLRARIPGVETSSSSHGAAQPLLLRGRSLECEAPKEFEAVPAGVLYGMDAIMAGAAYAEDTSVQLDDAQVSFIGSSSLLLHAETGARVHYDGRSVSGDPSPRGLPSREALASPRKRSSPCNEHKDSHTVCDLLLTDNAGLVIITAWEEFVHTWYATMDDRGTPHIRLTNIRVADLSRSEWNGTYLTRIKVLHSTSSIAKRPGMALGRMVEPTSPYLTRYTYTTPE